MNKSAQNINLKPHPISSFSKIYLHGVHFPCVCLPTTVHLAETTSTDDSAKVGRELFSVIFDNYLLRFPKKPFLVIWLIRSLYLCTEKSFILSWMFSSRFFHWQNLWINSWFSCKNILHFCPQKKNIKKICHLVNFSLSTYLLKIPPLKKENLMWKSLLPYMTPILECSSKLISNLRYEKISST